MKKYLRRSTVLVLVLLLAIGTLLLVPGTGLAAAKPILLVGETEVYKSGESGKGWSYKNGVLTLDGYSDKSNAYGATQIISNVGNLTIALKGKNYVGCIYSYGNVTIKGGGQLALRTALIKEDGAPEEYMFPCTLCAYGRLTIAGGTINIVGGTSGVGTAVPEEVWVSQSGIEADDVRMTGGSISISKVDAGITGATVTISGGTLKVRSIYAGITGEAIEISGKPNVDVAAKNPDGWCSRGIYAYNKLKINLTGGKVSAKGQVKKVWEDQDQHHTDGGAITVGDQELKLMGDIVLGSRNYIGAGLGVIPLSNTYTPEKAIGRAGKPAEEVTITYRAKQAWETGWKPGWKNEGSGKWRYYNKNGNAFIDSWVKVENKWYFMDINGLMKRGWYEDNNNTWYYFGQNGAMVTGWQKVGKTWYFLKPSSGAMATGWQKIGGSWYYLGGNGAMRTNWFQDKKTWYYADGSGVMQTGWKNTGGVWYYLRASGAMVKNDWINDAGTWYYLKSSGAIATGWTVVGNDWYYMASNGAMQTGWAKLGNTWYYLNADGSMTIGTKAIDGKAYTFDNDGKWIK